MRYPNARWNPSPDNCFAAFKTPKSAVCDHRMAGSAGYLRNFTHVKEGRLISAHFSISLGGTIEQHVDTDFISWCQGIREKDYWRNGVKYNDYEWAREHWPLFRERNPNLDCISVEHEDGRIPFSDERPMPRVMLEATLDLHEWLFEHVIKAEPKLWVNLIRHDQLTQMRNQDPSDWTMRAIRDGLAFRVQAKDAILHLETPKPETPSVEGVSPEAHKLVEMLRGEVRDWRKADELRWDELDVLTSDVALIRAQTKEQGDLLAELTGHLSNIQLAP